MANAEIEAIKAERRTIKEKAQEIRPKYEPLFWRQPNVWSTAIGIHRDENGCLPPRYTGVIGFKVYVTKKVDQDTLPPEDRIPDVIEGIPVQILEGEKFDPFDPS